MKQAAWYGIVAAIWAVPGLAQTLAITTTLLPGGTAGTGYAAGVAATGGTTPYGWGASGLPPGLGIDPASGAISGTPNLAGSYTATVTVTDALSATASQSFPITIALAVGGSVPNGTVGLSYTGSVSASGGTPPYSFSAIGLPPGLGIDPASGAIGGTPTTAGPYSIAVTVIDAGGAAGSNTFPMSVIVVVPPVSITTTALPNGTVGSPYSATVTAVNGTTPYTWSATGLPAGVNIDPVSGLISGTPLSAVTTTVGVTVTDANGLGDSKSYSVTIVTPPTISTASLPNSTVSASYSAALAASGGTTPYTWSATGLPSGLSLNTATGQITGTPTAAGSATVNMTLTDANGLTASKSYTFSIAAALAITTASLPNGTVSSPYSATLAASGGTTPYTWSATGLPSGLSLNTATGQITGTPTASGSATVNMTLTDANGLTASKSYSFSIAAALAITTASLPNGTVSSPYSATLAASGGTTPYTWSATGLPSGLSLNTATGQITGTPTASGSATVNVTLTDANALTASKSYTFSIAATLAITTASLPNGLVNSPYSAAITASGGTTPYTWSATGLPSGLSLNTATGQITGTPTASGTATVNVTVTDANALTAVKSFNFSIAAALAITTASLPNGTVNAPYSAALAASGGTTPYTWSATGLPTGLSLNTATGQVTGTPTASGTATVNVTVTDANALTAVKSFNFSIAAALAITTASLPNGTVNAPYSAALAASGGTTPYTWSATGLPAGLSVNTATGQVTGTPTTAGPATVNVTVRDVNGLTASKSYTFSIVVTPTITTASLPNGTVNAPYSAALAASGGTTPYTWSATGLPAGLSVNTATGQVTGTPTAAGPATVNVTVRDANGLTAIKSYTFSIVVTPTITTASLPNGTVNAPYSAALAASGGTTPYTWSATGLPAGLSVNTATGQVTGTPTAAGPATVNVTVRDANGLTAIKSYTLSIVVTPTITTASLPNGTVNAPYSAAIAASGGTTPYTWSATGLPAGLSLNTATGQITGTPTTAGPATVNVTVRDASGLTAIKSYTFSIVATLTITTASLPNGTVNAPYSAALAASGGTAPYTWSATGLPAGLSLNTGTGQITGTPTTAGPATVNVTVRDANGLTAVKSYTLSIAAAPAITTASLPNGTVSLPYSAALAASGGTTPYTWSATGLPAGLSVNTATGQVTGTPTTAGPATVNVTVRDANAVTAVKSYTISITAAPAITTASLPNGTVSLPYSAAIAASGGTTPYTWSAIGLPAGLSLNATTGQISGTPAAAGPATVNVTVRDANAVTASKSYSVSIAAQLAITTETLPNSAVGSAYAATLAASGGVPPYTWSAGGLPPGVSLNAQTGALSGSSTTAGSYTVSVTAADNAGSRAAKSFSVSIVAGLVVATNSLPGGKVASAYSASLSASGGAPPYTWSVTSGSLPAGFTLDGAAGSISGTPTAVGTSSFTVQVTDSGSRTSTANLSIVVAPATVPLAIGGTLGSGATGSAYSQSLTATGGTPPYTWTVVAGSLPPGLVLGSSGGITGTPTQAGTYNFTVQVADSVGATTTQTLTITVSTGLLITIPNLPGGSIGTAYNQVVSATGGSPPYTWSVSAGALPTGLTLGAQSGLISGTPTAAGLFAFTIQARDSAGVSATQSFSVTIGSGLTITSTSPLAPGAIGSSYSQALAAISGVPPYTWSVSAGALPTGVVLDPSTGLLSGKPTKLGAFNFTIKVTDAASTSSSKAFSITIVSALTVSTSSLPPGSLSVTYAQILAAVAGTSPYTWSVSTGSLPPGLALDPATGAITGTPTTQGTYNFTVQVTDAVGATATQALSILIGVMPMISSGPVLPGGTLNTAYSTTLAAAGGTPPYTWSISAGALPGGLTLNATSGAIAGTPTAAGAFSFTVQVSDAAHATATAALTLNIGVTGLPTVTIAGLSDTAAPLEQPTVTLSLSGPAPTALTGQLVLTFESDAAVQGDDPSIQFSTGGRTADFTIAAQATSATFPSASLLLQTGSVAGTITLTVKLEAGGADVTPSPAPGKTVKISRTAPVIRALKLVTAASGFEVWITGYSPSRELTQAAVQFTGAAGSNLQTTSVTVPLSGPAGTWYADTTSQLYGSQFTIVQPFTVVGTANAVTSVSVTLSNAVGTSSAVSASF